MTTRRTLLIGFLAAGSLRADLDAVKAEKNLLKRARLAMEHADATLDKARDVYLKGEMEEVNAALQELEDSVKLAYASLQETGRRPRKISRHYKRAEIGARKLLRRLESFKNEMSYLEREKIEAVMKNVEKVQSDLLNDVMGGGR